MIVTSVMESFYIVGKVVDNSSHSDSSQKGIGKKFLEIDQGRIL